jgi:opacity protein-like surface antigen
MRKLSTATAIAAIALVFPSIASAQGGQLQGFGGLTFGDVTDSSTFGGNVAIPLSDNLQIVGEGGRMTDLMPSFVGTLVDLTPVDLRVSAWYGEGGLRFIAPSGRSIRPYVETTAGFARLTTGLRGVGSTADVIVNTGLQLFGRNEPLVGAGAGVVFQGGPVFLDLGYRYKRIFARDSLQGLIAGGDIGVNQLRVGAGVRF